MRKIILGLSITVFVIGISRAQEVKSNLRFIEVTGSAETSVEPDEIRFQIGIQEYWKEEYERGKKYKDYITKIPLIEIEKNLMRSLVSVGIAKDQIVIKEIGQNWNRSGKDFKKSNYSKPVILMGYYNMIYQYGESNFLKNCKKSGVNVLIVVDLPWPENKSFSKKCKIKKINFPKLENSFITNFPIFTINFI